MSPAVSGYFERFYAKIVANRHAYCYPSPPLTGRLFPCLSFFCAGSVLQRRSVVTTSVELRQTLPRRLLPHTILRQCQSYICPSDAGLTQAGDAVTIVTMKAEEPLFQNCGKKINKAYRYQYMKFIIEF